MLSPNEGEAKPICDVLRGAAVASDDHIWSKICWAERGRNSREAVHAVVVSVFFIFKNNKVGFDAVPLDLHLLCLRPKGGFTFGG